MNTCTPTSVFQLFAAALSFLLAVLWLETHRVRIAEDLHSGCGCAAEARLAQCFGGAWRGRRDNLAAVVGGRLRQRCVLGARV